MQNTCGNGYLMVAVQGLGVSSDWHDYIGLAIFLTLVVLGILIMVFRRQQKKLFGQQDSTPTGKPVAAPQQTKNAPPTTAAASNPTKPLDAKLRAGVERFGRGDATAISVFSSSQEANARAQAKLFTSWVVASGCALDVYLLKAEAASEHKQFLLLKVGSRDSQWDLTNSVRTADFRKLQSEVLSSAESAAISPVSCYENFPQPGCSLTPSGTLQQIVEQIKRGEYSIQEISLPPNLKKPSTTSTAQATLAKTPLPSGDISSLVPNLSAFIQEERAKNDNDPGLTLQRGDYETIFKAMAGLPIQPAANLPPKATQKDAVSATTAVPHMAFLLAQSIAQGARLKIEAVGNGMLRVQAGPLDWRVGRTGTNEFRVWFEG